MNLFDREYREFTLEDIFIIKYGVNLELVNCIECEKTDKDKVNFVSRTAENNGVSAYVKKIDGIEPQKAGLISVAGGGSVLSTFLQSEPFYSGRDLYTLEAKESISDYSKLFIITIIEQNKYKYSYGRQANRTLQDLVLKLPVNKEGNLDYQYMEDCIKSLHYKPITTTNHKNTSFDIKANKWQDFLLSDYFDITAGIYHYPDEFEEGLTPYYSASNENNGISCYIDLKPDFKGNCIITGKIGCTAFYAPTDFCATSDVNIFSPKFRMTPAIGLFIVSVINYGENYKWAYGRQCRVGNSKKISISLPAIVNNQTNKYEPDWEFMENYIKSLPYGDRI